MPLNYIQRKRNGSYSFTKLKEKLNHYMTYIKIFAKNKKEL